MNFNLKTQTLKKEFVVVALLKSFVEIQFHPIELAHFK